MDEYTPWPQVPELAGLAEVATILGVSKQRVRELAEGDDTFPLPVAVLSGGAIYVTSMVEEFKRHWSRQPGRPAKSQAQIPAELARIPTDKGNLGQQTLRMAYNATRKHDLSVDSLTPAGQTLWRAVEMTRKQDGGFEPDYDRSFFQLEQPDTRYVDLHAECCPELADRAQ